MVACTLSDFWTRKSIYLYMYYYEAVYRSDLYLPLSKETVLDASTVACAAVVELSIQYQNESHL